MSPPRSTATHEAMSDAELLTAIRARDAAACDALIARHLRMMHRLAFRLAGAADLDDILQDSVFLALRALPKLKHADGLPTWFASIVVSVVRKAARRRRLLSRLGFVDAVALDNHQAISPSAPPDVVAELKAVYAAVERLPTRAREALILRRIERRPLDEIATIMGTSLASVKRWVAAGEDLLGQALEPGKP